MKRIKTIYPLLLSFSTLLAYSKITEKKERTGNASRDDGIERRKLVLQEFTATYSSRPATLKEEVVLCGAWAEGYKIQGDNYTYVPIIPKLIPAAVRSDYETLAEAGWKTWMAR